MALRVDGNLTNWYSAANALSSTSAPFTMGGWYKSLTRAAGTLMSLGASGSNNQRWTLSTTTTPSIVADIRTTTTLTVANDTPWLWNEWIHVMLVEASSTDHSLFVNGIKVNDTNSKAPTAGTDLRFGITNASAANHPNLIIGPQALWSGIALSDDDVFALAYGAQPQQIRPDSLTLCWLLDTPTFFPRAMSVGTTFNFMIAAICPLWAPADSPIDPRRNVLLRNIFFNSTAAPTGRIWYLAGHPGGGLAARAGGLAG